MTQSRVHLHPARGQLKGLNHTVGRSLWIAAHYTLNPCRVQQAQVCKEESHKNCIKYQLSVTFFTLKNKFKFRTGLKISNSTANGALRQVWIISSLMCFMLWRNSRFLFVLHQHSCGEHMEIKLDKSCG